MPRYIIIDNASGYVYGDTADFAAGRQNGLTPEVACELLDTSIHGYARKYEEVLRLSFCNESGYHVYRAKDINDPDAIGIVENGQDAHTIDEVKERCDYVTAVRVSENVDGHDTTW